MLGIGNRLDREAKQKILAERAQHYNVKLENLTLSGMHPDDATKTLATEEFYHRHQNEIEKEPYNKTKSINALGGAFHQGFTETHKNISSTKAMYQQLEEGTVQNKSQLEALQLAKQDFERMKFRIKKDHLKEDAEIKIVENIESDYRSNFVDDEKMKKEVKRDKRHNQWQNDLKNYAQAYLRSKQCLRRC